ncbi:MAG: dihydroxyacetone kinase subunit DhaL [Caldisericota bacterium]|nr:dihydroxyacetone kinase subunit DhaL [Caldisericota bacterium]
MPATIGDVVKCLAKMCDVLHENKEYLTELDSAIGDADHGTNMDRGFQAIAKKLPDLGDTDIGAILKTCGMTLITTVGGASGPLYGTAFMQAGTALAGKQELEPGDLLVAGEAALKGILMRGKANLGDKTMVDAVTPAVDALRQALAGGAKAADALEQASIAAETGMKGTIPIQARKGRASYLGERSIGHQDPGATSSFLLIRTMAEAAREIGF